MLIVYYGYEGEITIVEESQDEAYRKEHNINLDSRYIEEKRTVYEGPITIWTGMEVRGK
jgi:hypothetical protein